MKISIVGTGYVGLVTGISLSYLGHQVDCIDSDKNKVSKINQGISPFYEPGLDEILKKLLKKNLSAAVDLEKSVMESDVIIIAVGTPTVKNKRSFSSKKIDLSFIEKSAEQIGEAMSKTNKYQVIAVKSTVLPGVSEKVVKPILEKYSQKKAGKDFGLCMNPEFLREGSALEDALNPDRIVIGQIDEKSGQEFAKIYSKAKAPKIFTNLWTAELIKYAANTLFATLISYANEIARISEDTGRIDVLDVWRGVHLDRRLSPMNGNTRIKPGVLNYILSGCGFGGSCFPKDIEALASFAKDQGVGASLIQSVIDINKTQPHRVILLLKKALGENLKDKNIAILGLSFKPNTDDTRQSPALPIIEELISEGAKIIIHDPMARSIDYPMASTIEEAIKQSDAVILVTAWGEYGKLTPQFFNENMKQPIVIDTRRIYDKYLFLNAGIMYKGIGL
ncbi:MAG: UDP-glucose/GDP-mannose dehydrogenase family protein [bacterium]|nr:UDP-glucose/GDP-mannose dehydrogenase family protein [bacterium]